MPITISKSKFVAGVQCLKRLYWQVHEPELAAEPDAASEAIMEQGREVGLLARQLFPGGVEVDGSDGLEQAIRTTRELVANREVPAIFEGTFEHGGVLVRVDILHRGRDGRWRLLEVKSTTDLKDHHLDDVGIQSRVVSRSGLDLASSCLAHVNRNYVFQGGSIDVRQFFRIRNLTRRVEKLQTEAHVPASGSSFASLINAEGTGPPPGRHCTDPVTCEFFDHCNPPRPDDHIGYLPRLHASAVEELAEMGVESIRDIPDDFPLNERQRRACTSVQTGEPWFSADLGKELRALKYPLYFMDFETVNPAIPRFPGMRPYDQMPFQWSVHVQREPGAATGALRVPSHGHEAIPGASSSLRCAAVLGKSGSIVVYKRLRVAAALGACGVAAGVRWADQENSASSLGLASRHSEPCLPPGVRRVVLAQVRAACARARDDLRGHGSRGWAGRWAGLGVAGAGRLGSDRAEQDQEGAAGLLRAGYAGDGQAGRAS